MIYKNINQKKKKLVQGPSASVIRYDSDKDEPVLLAHGTGHIASRIIAMAKENDIPLQEDPGLLENLLDMDLGDNIPPQLYSVIAEILLMIELMDE
jgi:flagellar biosynthesis protein